MPTNQEPKTPLFELGRIVATRGVAATMENDPKFRDICLRATLRHCTGDFGCTPEEDCTANLADLRDGCLQHGGGRILSRYHPDTDREFYDGDVFIQTLCEAGEIYTCIMYPDEY